VVSYLNLGSPRVGVRYRPGIIVSIAIVLHARFTIIVRYIDILAARGIEQDMNHDWVYPKIGGVIRQRRKQLKLTQEKLAPLVALSRTSLANIESGRQKILLHQLFAFAEALALQPADLLPKMARTTAQNDEVEFSTALSPHQRAQIARFIQGEDPIDTKKGVTIGKDKR